MVRLTTAILFDFRTAHSYFPSACLYGCTASNKKSGSISGSALFYVDTETNILNAMVSY